MNASLHKRILAVLAPQHFRDEEYLVPCEVFAQAELNVTPCASTTGTATGKLGTAVEVELPLADARAADFDAVIYVGGPGSKNYWDDADAHRLAHEFDAAGKLIGAICSAPITLARAGLLTDRAATCFEGDRAELIRAGAVYTGAEVTLDGRFITANGPAAAEAFAHTLVERLGAGMVP